MPSNDLTEIKRDYIAKIENLERKHLRFKSKISVIFNLLIPGLGFLVFGKDAIKGIVSFVLFYGFIFAHFNYILPNTDGGIAILYFSPAIIIWIVSAFMVGSLQE